MKTTNLPRTKMPTTILVALLLLFSLACGLPAAIQSVVPGDTPIPTPTITPTPQPLPPALVEVDPPPGSRLALDQPLTFYFNQAIVADSAEEAIQVQFLTSNDQALTHSVDFEWLDETTLVVSPGMDWLPDLDWTVEIAATIQAANGLSMTEAVSLPYQTAPYLEVTQKLPEPAAYDVNPASAIVVSFNQPVVALGADPAGLPDALEIDPLVDGHGEWVNTSTYIFYPDTALFGGASYTVTVSSDLVSTMGSPIFGQERWHFITASPRLVSMTPDETGGDIPLDAAFTLTFNQPMDTISVEGHFTLMSANGEFVPGTFEWQEGDSVAIFTPSSLLARDTTYRAEIPFGAQARGGTPLGQTYTSQVHTVPELAIRASDPAQGGDTTIYAGVTLYFSAPLLDDEDLLDYVSISPEVSNLSYWVGGDNDEFNLYGDFKPLTEYVFTLQPGFSDPWGGQLASEYQLEFSTRALSSELIFTQYATSLFLTPQDTRLGVQATNIDSVDLSLGSLPYADFITFLQDGSYDYFQEYQPANAQVWRHTLDLPGDQMYAAQLPIQPDGTGLEPGLYYLSLDTAEVNYPPGPFVLVSSNTHLTLKLSSTWAFVWALDLRTNAPVSGATVGIYDRSGALLVSGQTDADGIFQSAIPAQKSLYSSYFAMIGQPGDPDFALSLSNWNMGIEGYDFGLSTDYSSAPEVDTYTYTDRPIYRPGQTVYFRVLVHQAYNGRYSPAYLESLPITMYDHNNNAILEKDYPVSSFGTLHGEYPLSEDAQPGTYQISTGYGYLSFDVAEYRKPEINMQVGMSNEEDDMLADAELNAQVEARYFFDAPAGDLPLNWELYKRRAYFYLPGYRVGPSSNSWLYPSWMSYGSYFGEHVDSGEGQTDAEGKLALDFEIPPEEYIQNYTLEATITDESGYPISARAEITVHPAEYYIGVRPDTWMGRAGEEINFEALTVDWEQHPTPDRELTAIFQKVTWLREESNHPYGFPSFTPQYEEISNVNFRTGSDGVARLAFIPPDSGTYQLEVSGDEGALTQVLVWVGGQGQAVWPNMPNQRLQITADREDYLPGDTAEIFIPNPFGSGTQALVTVERSFVSRYYRLDLDEAGVTVSIPLGEEDAPNVFVSVSLIGENDSGWLDFRQGYVDLPVSPAAFELNLEVLAMHAGEVVSCEDSMTCPAHLEPRQEVTFDLRVTDADGQPVVGEFSLAVADLAALALADPNSREIFDFYYREQPLGVSTSMGLTRHVQRQVYSPGGMGGGGGGDFLPPFVREDFPDTAYWNAEIVTDANGQAQATFALPDSLTTWHFDVRGLTQTMLVGQAETHIVTSKELLVRPVTPRFVVVDDHLRIAAIVHNNSAVDLQVDIALQAAGFTLDDPNGSLQQVAIPAGGHTQVMWWGTVEEVEQVAMIFSASGQNDQGDVLYEDITKPVWGDLPVVRYNAPQTFGTAGILDDGGQRLELVSLPRAYDPGAGGLEIELSPSLAAAMTTGLEVLEHYPFECTEQTVSRFLPNLEAYRAIQSLGLDAPDLQARLERTLEDGLTRLVSTQNSDGGWGWWSGNESDTYMTAYVLYGLSRAEDAGVFVKASVIEEAMGYLSAATPALEMVTDEWLLDRMAFVYFAQSQALKPRGAVGGIVGKPILGGGALLSNIERLYEVRDQLSPWAQALLALSLETLRPGDERIANLISDLESTAIRTATGTHWEGRSSTRNMETAVFNSAVVIFALAQEDPASATLPEAVRYLMTHRDARGAWASTYETAWTLMALTEAMKGTGELAGDFGFSAEINGTVLAEGQAGGDARLSAVNTSQAVAHLYPDYPNALTIQREDGPGRLYYTAHLNVLRPVEAVEPLDAGISVARAYTVLGDEQAESILSAAAGNTLEVRLTLTLETEIYYLAVEDYIPAGAEIYNANLKTSQQGLPDYAIDDPFGSGWGWWYFNNPQIYDDHIAWAVNYLPAGTYELTYILVLNQPGAYRVLPAHAWQFYFPEVQGTSAGAIFEISE